MDNLVTINITEAIGPALNWAVALAEGHRPPLLRVIRNNVALPESDEPLMCEYLEYSEVWEQGGSIIEREEIGIRPPRTVTMVNGQVLSTREAGWFATSYTTYPDGQSLPNFSCYGSTALIAAMRCYVRTKLGETVDVPASLLLD